MSWAEQPREAQDDFVRTARQRWGERGWVYVISFNGEPAGTIGIDRHRPLISSADIWLLVPHGPDPPRLTTAAAAAAVEYAFDELPIHRLELRARLENRGASGWPGSSALGVGILRHGQKSARDYYDVYVLPVTVPVMPGPARRQKGCPRCVSNDDR
jgi:hypothetical protein